MVKAASHHGLDRKFKPWRRGKSQNAKSKKGSLKQQLRGLRRLLAKKTDNDEEHKAQIQQQIHELEAQIGEKEKIEQQKINARKSHGVRFLERQRLTRLWQMAAKIKDDEERQREQNRIGLDMLYVAHYPLQVRYQPLFRKKERILLDGRNLARRAAARGKILRDAKTLERVAWIPTQIYDNCPTEWSNEKERETFGVVAPSSETKPVDDRFSSSTDKHAAILQAAQAMDAELDAEEEEDEDDEEEEEEQKEIKASDSKIKSEKANKASTPVKKMEESGDDSSSSDGIVSDSEDDDDDSDHADPLENATLKSRKRPAGEATRKDDESPEVAKPPKVDDSDDDTSSSDSSSSSSSSDDDDDDADDDADKKMEDRKQAASVEKASRVLDTREEEEPNVDGNDDDDDDFLMSADAAPDATDIFANAKEHVPSMDEARGDKSQGWATQRQRPGQFKKRRMRK